MNNWKEKFIIGAITILIAMTGWGLLEIIGLKVSVATLSTQLVERERATLVNQARFDRIETDVREVKEDVATILRSRR